MTAAVLCLRPEADSIRAGVPAPQGLSVVYRGPGDPDAPVLLREVEALVIPAVGPKLAPELFSGAKLKLVQVTGAGVDRLDRAHLETLAIPVANVPGGSNGALAEYVLTSASFLLRRLMWSSQEIRRGNYVAFRQRLLAENIAGIEGLTVGLVGLGIIGLAVTEACIKAGAKVVYFDPAPRDAAAAGEFGAEPRSLDALLAEADVVSLHVPLLPQTRNLIGAPQLARMKQGAILIQASRGGIVDEAALAEALQAGHLGGPAVDVYTTEPPDFDNPLLALTGGAADRLLLTPHIAGVTRQAAATLFRAAWENVERVLRQGTVPLHRVY